MSEMSKPSLCFLFLASALVLAFGLGMVHGASDTNIKSEVAPTQVLLKKNCMVQGEKYLLGDIATIESSDPIVKRQLESLILGASPRLGYRKVLSGRSLLSTLEQLGVTDDAQVVSVDRLVIQREVSDLDVDSFRKALTEALLDEVAQKPEDVVLDGFHLPSNTLLPSGEPSFQFTFRLPRGGTGLVSYGVEVFVDGVLFCKLGGSLKLDQLVNVMKLRVSLKKGDVVSSGSCVVSRAPMSSLRGDLVTAQMLGSSLRARASLMKGDVLTLRNVEREILIRRGQDVRMVLQSGPLRITTRGKARHDGSLGDAIEVSNVRSGKILKATVVNRGMVRVEL